MSLSLKNPLFAGDTIGIGEGIWIYPHALVTAVYVVRAYRPHQPPLLEEAMNVPYCRDNNYSATPYSEQPLYP